MAALVSSTRMVVLVPVEVLPPDVLPPDVLPPDVLPDVEPDVPPPDVEPDVLPTDEVVPVKSTRNVSIRVVHPHAVSGPRVLSQVLENSAHLPSLEICANPWP